MTVAQLVHPVRSLTWPQYGIPFRSLRRTLFRPWSRNAIMWREIATGLGFALVALAMMAAALGAAGAVSPDSDVRAGAPDVVQTAPTRHSPIYQNPAEALPEAMPVP